MKIFSILLITFFLTSCASKRIYEKPNFNLQGKAARAEYEKFKLRHMNVYGANFESEDIFEFANNKEFRPLKKKYHLNL